MNNMKNDLSFEPLTIYLENFGKKILFNTTIMLDLVESDWYLEENNTRILLIVHKKPWTYLIYDNSMCTYSNIYSNQSCQYFHSNMNNYSWIVDNLHSGL
jgi:hypothetical protein